MLAALFLNPGFLFVAAALISVPIIIHLINRMRFKRIRWAAMEFLLKAQKRTRRRLIIEQLLLLALRCLLIGMVGLLVSSYVGCSDTNLTGKPNLHLVLLDDTLSMQDQGKQGDSVRTCFEIARDDVLAKKIAKALSLSKTNDKLIIVPLSRVHDEPTVYEHLNDTANYDVLKRDITELKPTALHVPMIEGLKAAQKLITKYDDTVATVHVLGDFRHIDWGAGQAGEALQKELLAMVKNNRDIKVRLVDVVYPPRAAEASAYPSARDNVGIIDMRPSTRIVGRNMPVLFTVSIKNFSGKEVKVNMHVRDELTGKEMFEVNSAQNPPNPFPLKPDSVSNVTFELRFDPNVKAGESHFAYLSARLTDAAKQPLDNDGLLADNLRYATVEVRESVPVLVIDGGDLQGIRDRHRDSFHIETALISVPGASYQVVFGDEIARGKATKALERGDLHRFPTIFMLNVPKLEPKQIENLENFVKEGGGVVFFLGPNVLADDYTKNLYKDGKGVFPAPLTGVKELAPKTGDAYQLLVRDEKFPNLASVPIFGPIFSQEKQSRETLRDLPIKKYFQVNRQTWKQEPGKVYELATLPNEAPIDTYTDLVVRITGPDNTNIKAIMGNKELAKYRARLEYHLAEMRALVDPSATKKNTTYDLVQKIDAMMADKGSAADKGKAASPDMTKFWIDGDPFVQGLRRDLANLREEVNYGDPYIVVKHFGKGRVVAVMSTAGRKTATGEEWNLWAGGSNAAKIYAPVIMEMQQFLSSQGGEANLTVGTDQTVSVDVSQLNNPQLKLTRWFMKPEHESPVQKLKHSTEQKTPDGSVTQFTLSKNSEPGLYLTEIFNEKENATVPLASYAHVFNVDTEREGALHRAGGTEMEQLVTKSDNAIKLLGASAPEEQLIGRQNNFSESPWLFLLFLLILVAEQALAVHLSFHLKSSEDLTPTVRTEARAA